MERDDEVNEATLATLPDVHRPASLIRLKRLGNITVNQLGAVGVDIEIEARPDGRVAVIMAPEWGSLLLANLEAQAVAFKEQWQRATWEAKRRDAETRAALGEAEVQWEDAMERVFRRYKALRAQEYGYRPALHVIRKESGEFWTITLLDGVIQKLRARERRSKGIIPGHDRPDRRKRIFTLFDQGFKPSEIADALDMSIQSVCQVLKKGRQERRRHDAKTDSGPVS